MVSFKAFNQAGPSVLSAAICMSGNLGSKGKCLLARSMSCFSSEPSKVTFVKLPNIFLLRCFASSMSQDLGMRGPHSPALTFRPARIYGLAAHGGERRKIRDVIGNERALHQWRPATPSRHRVLRKMSSGVPRSVHHERRRAGVTAHRPGWVSNRQFLGGMLWSFARLCFTDRIHNSRKLSCRSIDFQRTVNMFLAMCGIHRDSPMTWGK